LHRRKGCGAAAVGEPLAGVASILKGIVKRDAQRKQEINHADHNAQSPVGIGTRNGVTSCNKESFAVAAAAMPPLRLPVTSLTHPPLYVLFAQKPMHPLAPSNQDGIII
jgi:hypothetical protein